MVKRESEGSESPYVKMHEAAKRKQEKKKIAQAFKELGTIDKKHESGTYTTKQHDAKSKATLEKLVKQVK